MSGIFGGCRTCYMLVAYSDYLCLSACSTYVDIVPILVLYNVKHVNAVSGLHRLLQRPTVALRCREPWGG